MRFLQQQKQLRDMIFWDEALLIRQTEDGLEANPGVRSFLNQFSRDGFQQYVLTTGNGEVARSRFRRTDLYPYIWQYFHNDPFSTISRYFSILEEDFTVLSVRFSLGPDNLQLPRSVSIVDERPVKKYDLYPSLVSLLRESKKGFARGFERLFAKNGDEITIDHTIVSLQNRQEEGYFLFLKPVNEKL